METHRIEYKRELTPDLDLEKEVIAFLNTPEGGLIFIGIDETGTRVGVANLDGDMLKVKDRVKNNITPSAMGLFDVVAEESDGVACIKAIPRNKELMRAFKDLELVEHLGSGIPRITRFYPEECFHFTENFLRMTFPAIEPVYADEEANEATGLESRLESRLESKLAAKVFTSLQHSPKGKAELASMLGHATVSGELHKQIRRLLQADLIEMTIPNKPNSRLQKYRLTDKGRKTIVELKNK